MDSNADVALCLGTKFRSNMSLILVRAAQRFGTGLGVQSVSHHQGGQPSRPRALRWGLLLTAFVTSAGFAQTRGGTMKLIASGPPGTAVDVLARSLATHLGSSLGVTTIVENKVGVGGNIAAESAAMAPPDGMTLLVTPSNVATINPFVYSKLRYSFADDFIPVGHLGGGGYILVVNPKLGVRDVAGLITKAKQSPDTLNYASYGIGSGTHVCMELLQSMTGTRMKHVPYKAGTVNDLVGGVVDVGFEPSVTVISFVQAGKLTAIGNSSVRADILPNAAPVVETVPGYDCQSWLGIFASRKSPKDVLERLNTAIASFVNTDAAYKSYAKTLGLQSPPSDTTVLGLDKYVKAEAARSKAVLQKLAINLD